MTKTSKKAKSAPKKPAAKGLKATLKSVVKAATSKAKSVKKAADKMVAKSQGKGPTKPASKTAPKAPPVVAVKGGKAPKAAQNKTQAEKAEAIKAEILAATKQEVAEEVVLTNADGKQYCRLPECDNEATTEGFCRFHYLALWKRNRVKAKILLGGKLDKYIEDLTAKYPDKYLEMLRKDLSSEKEFTNIIAEMDVEEENEDAESEEDTNRFIEEVRGGVPTGDEEGDF